MNNGVKIRTTISPGFGVVDDPVDTNPTLIVEKPSVFSSGITGSLTQLSGGLPIFTAGAGIVLSTGSNGQITISGTESAVAAYWNSITNGSIFSTGSVAASGSGLFKSGLTGALNQLPDGSPSLVAGTNITLATGSKGQVTISTEGNTLWKSTSNDVIFTSGSIQVTGSAHVTGALNASSGRFVYGLTGALNILPDGRPFLIAGPNITLVTESWGGISIASTSTSSLTASGPDNSVQYSDTGALTGSSNFTFNKFDNSIFVGGNITGSSGLFVSSLFTSGLTGALNNLPNGTPFMTVGPNLTVATGSSGQITLTGLTDKHWQSTVADTTFTTGSVKVSGSIYGTLLSGSTGLQVTGSAQINGSTNITGTLDVSNTVNSLIGIFTHLTGTSTLSTHLTGTNFTTTTGIATNFSVTHLTGTNTLLTNLTASAGKFISGLTGALNDLPDGSPFLVAGTNITLSTGSKGQVTINGAATAPVYWTSTTNNQLFATGSVYITGSLQSLNLSSSNQGAHVTGSIGVTGGGLFRSGLTGALNILPSGAPYMLAGNNITLTTGSTGQITIATTAGSSPLTVTSSNTATVVPSTIATNTIIFANAVSGTFIINLPNVSAVSDGLKFYIKKIDATLNQVIVSGSLGQLIDSEANQIINQPYVAIQLVAYNTGEVPGWWLI